MLVDTIILSALVGKARKGKFKKLELLKIKKPILIIGAFFIQFMMVFLGMRGIEWVVTYDFYLHLFSFIMLLIAVWLNRDIKEMLIIGTGILLNFIVIFLNGGRMPISIDALAKSDMLDLADILESGVYPTHQLMENDTVLRFLGDIFSLPPPYPRPRVFSIGDVIIGIGLFSLIQRYMVDKKDKK